MLASFCYCLSITAWTHWNLWASLHRTIAPSLSLFIDEQMAWTDGKFKGTTMPIIIWHMALYGNYVISGIILAHALGPCLQPWCQFLTHSPCTHAIANIATARVHIDILLLQVWPQHCIVNRIISKDRTSSNGPIDRVRTAYRYLKWHGAGSQGWWCFYD